MTEEERYKGKTESPSSYDFEVEDDDTVESVRIKKKIGYADIPGVLWFNCNNCEYFKSEYCEKWKINVEGTACCSSWECKDEVQGTKKLLS